MQHSCIFSNQCFTRKLIQRPLIICFGSLHNNIWEGQYSVHVGGLTMVLEAITSQDSWICHSFFSLPSSLDDINMTCETSPIEYMVMEERKYTMGYYISTSRRDQPFLSSICARAI